MDNTQSLILDWFADNALDNDITTGSCIGVHDDILDLLDSIVLLELLTFCETTFSVSISPQEVTPENFASIAAIAILVENKNSETI